MAKHSKDPSESELRLATGDGRAGKIADPGDSDGLDTLTCDQRILQALRQLIRAVDIHSRKLASEYHITGPQLVCLLEVADHGPTTGTRIAQRVHLSASTVVGILDRLESKGLISRKRDRNDRRIVHVTVTASGRHLIDRAPSPLQASLYEALGQLPEDEQVRLADSLDKIAQLTQANAEALDATRDSDSAKRPLL